MKYLKTFEGLFSRLRYSHEKMCEDMYKDIELGKVHDIEYLGGPESYMNHIVIRFDYNGKKYQSKRITQYRFKGNEISVDADLSVWHDSGVWVPVNVSPELSSKIYRKLYTLQYTKHK